MSRSNMPGPRVASVLVVGAGSIGVGIVKVFARAGFHTVVLSRSPERLRLALPGVNIVSDLPPEAPDLVIESIPEVADLKSALFSSVEHAYAGRPIMATNTSGLPLSDLASTLRFPGRFVGTHYLFPADQTEFVEVVRTPHTSDETVASVAEAIQRCGAKPIVLARPVIGALVNRLQHAILREAYYLIDEGVVTAEQIDEVAKRLLGPRMCITGLLQQKDVSGLDTHALAQRSILPDLCSGDKPSKVLEHLYEQGHFGLKTGKGFYDWTGVDAEVFRNQTAKQVKAVVAVMKALGALSDAEYPVTAPSVNVGS